MKEQYGASGYVETSDKGRNGYGSLVDCNWASLKLGDWDGSDKWDRRVDLSMQGNGKSFLSDESEL